MEKKNFKTELYVAPEVSFTEYVSEGLMTNTSADNEEYGVEELSVW